MMSDPVPNLDRLGSSDALISADRRVASLFRSIDGADWAALANLLHDGIVYERPGYEPLVGKAAVLSFYSDTRIVASGRHDIERVLSDGVAIACWGCFSGVARDGRLLSARFADVYELQSGQIYRRRTFFDAPAI